MRKTFTAQAGRIPRRGFTLVEILGAILIISILAGLVTVGGRAAMRFFRGVNDKATIDNIAKALELYKNKYGEYPPDGTDMAAVRRHLLKRDPKLTDPKNIASLDELLGNLESAAENGRILTYWLCGENWINPDAPNFQMGESEFIDLNPGFMTPAEIGTPRRSVNYNIAARALCDARGHPVVYFRANNVAKDGVVRWLHEGGEWDEAESYGIVEYQNGESFYNEVRDARNPMPYADAEGNFDPENCAPYFTELKAGTGEVFGLHPYRHCEKHSSNLWYAPDTYQLILPGEDGLYVPNPKDPTSAAAEMDNVTNFCAGATMAEEEFEGRHLESE